MVEKIKSTLWALLHFGLALGFGYWFTVQMTGSVDKAIERMVVAIVLGVICALVWGVLCATVKALAWIARTSSNSRRESRQIGRRAGMPR